MNAKNDFLNLAKKLQHDRSYLQVASQLEHLDDKCLTFDLMHEVYTYKNFMPFCSIEIHHMLHSGRLTLPWSAQYYILSGGYWETRSIDLQPIWRSEGHHSYAFSEEVLIRKLDSRLCKEDTWILCMRGPCK